MITHQLEASTPIAKTLLRESNDDRTLIVDGYEIRLVIRGGMLQISDGISTGRRIRHLSRADDIKRIIILSESGMVTLEAMRWLEQEDIGVIQYGLDGHLIMMSGINHEAPRIQLAQSLASAGGLEVIQTETVRSFLSIKLDGQARIMRDHFGMLAVSNFISERLKYLGKAATIAEMIGYEGKAASVYWQAWKGNVSIPWDKPDRLPGHWCDTFPGRTTGTNLHPASRRKRRIESELVDNRGAKDPVNAMLNYAYRVAETEAKLACLCHGLNPGIGFMHSSAIYDRDAMTLDILEVVRPFCDQLILEILASSTFNRSWCYETNHGVVRLSAPLTHMICERSMDIARLIEPHVISLAADLANTRIPDLSGHEVIRHHHSPSEPRVRPDKRTDLQMPGSVLVSDVISDEQWQSIARYIPVVANRAGAKRTDDRIVLAALIWTCANGQPLSRLPESIMVHRHTITRRVGEWMNVGAWLPICKEIRRCVLRNFTYDQTPGNRRYGH